jgi:hypothetical protein
MSDPFVPNSTVKLRRQLHQSGLEMLSKCGVQFEFRYMQGLKRRPNAFLICGTATDKAVSADLDTKIDTGELAKEDVILDVARDAVEKHPDRESIELDADEEGKSISDILGETKDKAVRLVKEHHAVIAPTIEPAATAKRYSINLDSFLRERAKNMRVWAQKVSPRYAKVIDQQARLLNLAARDGLDFVGELDILETNTTIRDTKTSKKSPSAETANESHQLSAYSVAHKVLYGKLPEAVKLDYLIDLKGGVKTQTLASTRDNEDVEKYLNRLVAGVIQIQSGNFVPAPDTAWWCSSRWCAYHEHCPYVKHRETTIPELVQIQTSETNGEILE